MSTSLKAHFLLSVEEIELFWPAPLQRHNNHDAPHQKSSCDFLWAAFCSLPFNTASLGLTGQKSVSGYIGCHPFHERHEKGVFFVFDLHPYLWSFVLLPQATEEHKHHKMLMSSWFCLDQKAACKDCACMCECIAATHYF